MAAATEVAGGEAFQSSRSPTSARIPTILWWHKTGFRMIAQSTWKESTARWCRGEQVAGEDPVRLGPQEFGPGGTGSAG
jgi:hypothetical protein